MQVALTVSLAVLLLVCSTYGAMDNGRLSGFDGDSNSGSSRGNSRDRNTNTGMGSSSGSGMGGSNSRGTNSNTMSVMSNGAVCPNLSDTPKCNRGQSDSCRRDSDCPGSQNICCMQSSGCQKVCRMAPKSAMTGTGNNNMGNSRTGMGNSGMGMSNSGMGNSRTGMGSSGMSDRDSMSTNNMGSRRSNL